ncbi:MAG: ABC transporter permease [Rhodospirillales bacterium]|nr:ABC transporter permease [Rhodospirillales bacterium]
MHSMRQGLLGGAVAVILAYMTIPAVVVLMTSFSPAELLEFPPSGLSLRWYVKALTYPDFRNAFGNGLIVTAVASTVALAVGSSFAYLVDRYNFLGRGTLEGILASPLIIPHFTTGFGFLLLGGMMGLSGTYAVVIVTHVLLVLPFVTRSVYVSLRNLDPNLERSAANLGASPGRVLLHVTMPLLLPGMAGGWLIAAVLSFTEFTASLYVTAYRTQTLPVAMYTYIREYTDPTIAAISALLIMVTTTIMIVAERYLGLRRVLAIDTR